MAGAVKDILYTPDLKQGEIRNVRLHVLASDPSTPVEGQYWYNSTTKTINYYNGTEVKPVARLSDTHTHSNKTTLDAITAAFTAEMATKLSGIDEAATKVAPSATNGNIKISGIEITIYTHPASHAPSIIEQDSSNRFVSDTEKSTWNGKQDALGYTPENVANKGVANGYASLDSNGLVPVSQIPSSYKECAVVATIAERNALTDLFSGQHVYVTDASDDETVTSGGAEYIYNGTSWGKLSESESMDLVLSWANISGKPSSSVAEIDAAVAASHSHMGKNIGYYNTQIGDGTNTDFSITHSLNNTNPVIVVRRVASPYDEVQVGNEVVSANEITLYFKTAPTTNQFNVSVYG